MTQKRVFVVGGDRFIVLISLNQTTNHHHSDRKWRHATKEEQGKSESRLIDRRNCTAVILGFNFSRKSFAHEKRKDLQQDLPRNYEL